ncbi:helix-turn-helix transcriptional regulator [Flavobacteriaceae bacterium S356]|uniref:Helix-turn-helix transcriptional regulator n=1 Tax=Asprobacillus argus TaxID=3076534 RepID=A0ABU3LFH6_9FLAO|nr:helix-turn-helix transcriptional regulator [Flavobacteriaceae bacterium S356]
MMKNIRRKTCLFVILFCVMQLTAQNDASHLDSLHYEKILEFSHKNNDSLIFYGKELQKSTNKCYKADGYINEARGFYQRGSFKEAKRIIHLAILFFEDSSEICLQKRLVSAYRRLFYIYKNREDYGKALEYLLKQKKIIENLAVKDYYFYKNELQINLSLASLKEGLGFFEQALEILRTCKSMLYRVKGKKLSKEDARSIIFFEAHMFNLLGKTFISKYKHQQNESLLDSAEVYYNRSYSSIKVLPNSHTEPQYLIRRAKLSILRKEYKFALLYLNDFDKLKKKFPQYLHEVFYYKTIVYKEIKKHDSVIAYGKKYLKIFKENPSYNQQNLLHVYSNLTYSFSFLNQKGSALHYSNLAFAKYKELEDSKKMVSENLYTIELEALEKINEDLNFERNNNFFLNLIYAINILILLVVIIFIKKRNLKRKISKKKIYKKEIDEKLVNTILNKLKDFENTELYLSHQFTIDVLAKHLNINTTYVSKVINKHKHQTFSEYLSHLRIEYVIRKLEKDTSFSKYSIAAIGKEVGYKNASAFTRRFKEIMNVTPSEYINSKQLIKE